jgi:ADP-heptose:LPS heptosyltransferase
VEAARRFWNAPSLPIVLLGPAASRPSKQWPLERYVALARALAPKAAVGVLFDDERAFRGYTRFRRELEAHARLVHTPRLADAMAHLTLARCYAGSDSGIKHLAAASGTATVTFFGPESVAEWHGYDERRHRALQAPVGCRTRDADRDPGFAWCAEAICPLASHACLTQITVGEAAQAIEGFLRNDFAIG